MKEILFSIVFGIFFFFLLVYFHFLTPNFIYPNHFYLSHFGLEEIRTEKEYYEILGFPETKEFEERKEKFRKAIKVKQVIDLFIFGIFILQIKIFRRIKEIKFLNSIGFYILLCFFYLFSLIQNNKILYLLSDRGIGTTEIAIFGLDFINYFYYGFHFFAYLFLSFLFWLSKTKVIYKFTSFCFLNSSFLIIAGMYRIELMEFSYFFEKLGLVVLVVQNFFLYKQIFKT